MLFSPTYFCPLQTKFEESMVRIDFIHGAPIFTPYGQIWYDQQQKLASHYDNDFINTY